MFASLQSDVAQCGQLGHCLVTAVLQIPITAALDVEKSAREERPQLLKSMNQLQKMMLLSITAFWKHNQRVVQ